MPYDQDTEQQPRNSIWAIPEGWEGTYLLLFVLQVVAWTSLLSWRTACCSSEGNVFDIVLSVGMGMAAVMVTSAGSSMIQVEGIVIYAEKFLRKRYAEGRQAGLEEGREAGHIEGREEGRVETDRLWRNWYARYLEAQAKGEAPPPPPDSER